jgi:hypothetical protein
MEEQGSPSRNGKEVLYRLVFLPLADDRRSISHVLGAFSFRSTSRSERSARARAPRPSLLARS